MNNSVFGKTMENLRKRVDVKLVTTHKKLDKLTSKPTYVSSKIFNQNLMAVHKIKEALALNRPAYVGMCILDTHSEQLHHKMKTIRSQKHQLGSCEINKVSLSCFDDNRYIHDNGISSYAYGHYKIE